ncbi:CD276 antigen-like isoform X1 [Acipenser ruthenus]|uniref:CD276 antigen-like isoform X1 n=1 Tax=Acipenser ruthenus TaxID=7906 RepID=UPI002740CFA6|nr:CD276 antigen-like isoform X1 [Acipenser ruthenus]XP_058865746.1 CD276 antigen-like isoform X1 [Acipenser ruthenus]
MHTLFIQESVCVCILLSGITTVISSLPMIPNNKTILSRVGDQTTLPCTFTPKTSDGLIVTWTKIPGQTVYFFAQGKEDPGIQEERYKNRTFVNESRFNKGDFTLFLEDTRVSDEGNYQCFVRFKPADFESSSLELYVAANYTKPVASCLQSNSAGSTQEASAVTLSCQTEGGYPEAQLVWTFSNGTRVHSAAQRRAIDSKGLVSIQSSLVIARALSENLTCGIHNSRLSQSFFTSVTCSLPSSAGSFQNEERKRPGLLASVVCFVSSLLSLIVKKASCC